MSNFKKDNVAVVDGFFNTPSINKMRRFCLESAFWKMAGSRSDYVGTELRQGFYSGLLFQIASELQKQLPSILGKYSLYRVVAFRYPHPHKGIPLHIDGSLMTANFWVTPDEANLDQEKGGVILHKTKIPKNWKLSQGYDNENEIRELLAKNNDPGQRVPYRCNRMVMFESDRFHSTDEFHFSNGYENRRVNIAIFFGELKRGAAG